MYSEQAAYAIGHVGQVTTTKGVTRFSVALNQSWKDKESGQKKERTDWLNFVAFDKTGENVAKYVEKGCGVKVDFTIRPNKFEKDGVDHYTYDLVVERFNILSDPA